MQDQADDSFSPLSNGDGAAPVETEVVLERLQPAADLPPRRRTALEPGPVLPQPLPGGRLPVPRGAGAGRLWRDSGRNGLVLSRHLAPGKHQPHVPDEHHRPANRQSARRPNAARQRADSAAHLPGDRPGTAVPVAGREDRQGHRRLRFPHLGEDARSAAQRGRDRVAPAGLPARRDAHSMPPGATNPTGAG